MLTQDDVIYFIVTDRFSNGDSENDQDVDLSNPDGYHGGDFQGIIDRIPYLQHLGITALWITPVFENSHLPQHGHFGYHGYWPFDFDKVDPHLYSPKPGVPAGSKRYLKDLVDQLHAAGIKVILDIVVNHTAYDHPGLQEGGHPIIKPHWFNPPKSEQEVGDIGSWLAGLPDLKADIPEVADYLVQMVADWIGETGVDCIRMDTAKHVEGIFWHYYKTVIKGKFPSISLLGEVLDYNIDHISSYQRHFAFDSLFDFPLQRATENVFIFGDSCKQIAAPYSTLVNPGDGILDQDNAYTNHNKLVTLLDNHDLAARFLTRALEHSEHNHGWAEHTLKLALIFMLTSRGIPQIYYGTELGLEGRHDPDNRRDMPWHLIPNGLEPDSSKNSGTSEIFQLTKQLIGIRKASQALKYGSQFTLYVDDRIYVYMREYRNEWVVVAINLNDEDMTMPLEVSFAFNELIPPRLKEDMTNQQYVDILRQVPSGFATDKIFKIQLNKRSAAILMPLKQMLLSVA
ncbi:hypothetical protein BH11PAT4_BH11PAT4_3600 [soil metagenome]